jgi:hypothetical protein
LANNSVTINGSSVSLGGSVDISAGTDWQSVVTADGSTATTASAGEGYFIDTTSNAHTFNLPSSPTQGDEVTIVDYAGTFGTNNVTVGRNGSNIDGIAVDGKLATNRLNVRFVYIDATQGWKAIFDDASGNYGTTYISATGGTVTESGDYKIHTFTGDGCFVVSQAGVGDAPTDVDYLVVAGGGGGGTRGGGGAGAGGFRISSGTASGCYTVGPLGSCVPGITVTATTYPITVGAGGGTNPAPPCQGATGNNGSNSVFSTITSAGGGYSGGGGVSIGPVSNGGPGGSGGGGAWDIPGSNTAAPGGTGNTPPVSPPQGQNGGYGRHNGPTHATPGGGGGAGAAGSNEGSGGPAGYGTGDGGDGSYSNINPATGVADGPVGGARYYAGGGGGNTSYGGNAGAGGGGPGAPGTPIPGRAGTANTGGGGGGGPCGPVNPSAGSGGKGIVVIRYKFQ